jgi:hypothetical protein
MKLIKRIIKLAFSVTLPMFILSSIPVLGNTNCHKNRIIQLPETEEITLIITDKETGKSIPFAYFTVGINDSLEEQFMVDSIGTMTFNINVNQNWQLKVSSLGYEPLILENFKFSASKPMTVQLKPVSIKLDTFTLVEKKVTLIDYCRCGCGCRWVTIYPDIIPEFVESETPKVQIMAYPNPTLGEVTITNLEDVSEFYLLDMSGRVLQTVQVSNTNEQLDLSQYATGIYIIQYLEKGKVNVLKIIKE